jgi:dihydroneopterin aldolase
VSSLRRGEVRIQGLQVWCVIGVLAEERDRAQQIEVDCTLSYDRYPDREELEQAIDYTALAELIRKVAVDGRYQLLERLCADAAEACLERFPVAQAAAVTIRKPQALEGAAIPSVHVELSRQSS